MMYLGYRFQRTTLKSKNKRVLRNRCQCTVCYDIIESKSVHDLVRCKCGRIFTDGGTDYIRRGWTQPNDILDLTEFTIDR